MESGAKADPRNLDYISPPTASTHSLIDARFAPCRLTVLGPAVHSGACYLSIYLSIPALPWPGACEREGKRLERVGGWSEKNNVTVPRVATSPVDVLVGGRMGKRRDENVWRPVPER